MGLVLSGLTTVVFRQPEEVTWLTALATWARGNPTEIVRCVLSSSAARSGYDGVGTCEQKSMTRFQRSSVLALSYSSGSDSSEKR